MNIEDAISLLINDGNWWFDPWWEQDRWYALGSIKKVRFLEAIEFLKTIFSKEWVKSLGDDPLRHPFLQLIFFGQGLPQINNIYQLAKRLQVIIRLNGHKSALQDYKTINQAYNADFEMFLAYVFHSLGSHVSFIVAKSKKGRTPDILVNNNGIEFVVECKYIQPSEAERWVSNYSLAYSHLLMDALPTHYEMFYRLRQTDINVSDYSYPKLGSFQLAAIIDSLQIINYLKNIGPFSPKYNYIDMGTKGELFVIQKGNLFRSQIQMPEISQSFTGRRLVGNAIIKANRQISEFGMPGIAAIYFGAPPDIGALKLEIPKLFCENKEQYSLLMGIIVFPMQNLLKYIRPIWIANPFSKFRPQDYRLPELLVDILDPYI